MTVKDMEKWKEKRREEKRREEKRVKPPCSLKWRTIVVIGILGSGLYAGTYVSADRFGTYCQIDYQYKWQNTLDKAHDLCGRFINELDDTDASIFYYTLVDQKSFLEEPKDQYTTDNVSLLFILTHGKDYPTFSAWAMWNFYTFAVSNNMRLGDESFGLSILASWACLTHKHNDNLLLTRWRKIFRGGLRITVGSHDKIYTGTTTDECGKEFADNLQDGDKIKDAWHDALREPFSDNDGTVIATGETLSECESRRDNMKWQNYMSHRRLRDGQNAWYCWTYWENL